mmetsp:Transcript_29786/g.67476  ORF Transcript_29786/g.67476 Transcript_29786/m.67476 type:complete len:237 (-) Transcript_29786:193-903(-)
MLDAQRAGLETDLHLRLGGVVRQAGGDLNLVRVLPPVVAAALHLGLHPWRHWRRLPHARVAGMRHARVRRSRVGHPRMGHPWMRQLLHEVADGVSFARNLVCRGHLVTESHDVLHRLRDDALWVLGRLDMSCLALHSLQLKGQLALRLDHGVPKLPCNHSLREEAPVATGIAIYLLQRRHVPDGSLHESILQHVLCLQGQCAHPDVIVSRALPVLLPELLLQLAVGLDLVRGQGPT